MERGINIGSKDVEQKGGHVTWSWKGFSVIRDDLTKNGAKWEKNGNNTFLAEELWQKN